MKQSRNSRRGRARVAAPTSPGARLAPRPLHLKPRLLLTVALAALPLAGQAQFTDPFGTINPAWVTNRYAPAGFTSVSFGGDQRLQLTIDQTGGTAARAPEFGSPFYNTQGRQRPGDITGPWTLSAEVFVSSAFNTTTGPLVNSELWGHTGTTPGGGAYMIFGFTNASLTVANTLDPTAADRTFRFRAYDNSTGNWFDLGVPAGFVFNSWHTLSAASTGSAFEFRLDGVLVFTHATSAGSDLLSAMVQGYNFGEAGSYSVLWDNVTASAIPEPATTAIAAAIAALGLALWRRRAAASGASRPGVISPSAARTPARDFPSGYTP